MRKLSRSVGLCAWILMSALGMSQGFAQSDTTATVKIEASPSLLELLKTWDANIWFFTPADKPLHSLEGLQRKDVACWGGEHFGRMQELFKVLAIDGEGVKVMGDGRYNDAAEKPLLYVTWAKNAPNLKGAARVEFVERKAAPPK